ncbi:hypothetical protein J6590_044665 [Homalodisca vitripennis]|nr:hypothetical protein J6590_044665 [Homalodisca vitripennis]
MAENSNENGRAGSHRPTCTLTLIKLITEGNNNRMQITALSSGCSWKALVDCSWGEGNNGCDGGEDFRAYQWMMKHGGLPLEADYGNYLGQDGYCHINGTPTVAAIMGYVNVTSNDPEALKVALLKHGPISVAIDASNPTFTFYANGIYNEKNCSEWSISISVDFCN